MQNKLLHYLNGDISLKEFCHWFVTNTWDVDNSQVNEMKLRLAELSNRHWTEDEFRSKISTINLDSLSNF